MMAIFTLALIIQISYVLSHYANNVTVSLLSQPESADYLENLEDDRQLTQMQGSRTRSLVTSKDLSVAKDSSQKSLESREANYGNQILENSKKLIEPDVMMQDYHGDSNNQQPSKIYLIDVDNVVNENENLNDQDNEDHHKASVDKVDKVNIGNRDMVKTYLININDNAINNGNENDENYKSNNQNNTSLIRVGNDNQGIAKDNEKKDGDIHNKYLEKLNRNEVGNDYQGIAKQDIDIGDEEEYEINHQGKSYLIEAVNNGLINDNDNKVDGDDIFYAEKVNKELVTEIADKEVFENDNLEGKSFIINIDNNNDKINNDDDIENKPGLESNKSVPIYKYFPDGQDYRIYVGEYKGVRPNYLGLQSISDEINDINQQTNKFIKTMKKKKLKLPFSL